MHREGFDLQLTQDDEPLRLDSVNVPVDSSERLRPLLDAIDKGGPNHEPTTISGLIVHAASAGGLCWRAGRGLDSGRYHGRGDESGGDRLEREKADPPAARL